ncbi:T9SS type A sorting domain-containing protein [bacterium]|nr:T9SS type A sorting domain-containing protein [bacterium]
MKKVLFLCISVLMIVGSAWAQNSNAVRDDRDRLIRSLEKSELNFNSIAAKKEKAANPNMLAACTDIYVNAATGNDSWDGESPVFTSGMNGPKATIQAGIDAVCASGTVHVYPGSYNETAAGRFVLGVNGPHQFGLFIDKDNITIQGVDGSGTPITAYAGVLAEVATNATNNFGYSGIFVEADGVTIQGLKILSNTAGDNKTFEIIGDAFTLKYCDITTGYSVYFNDWRYDDNTTPGDDTDDVSHVKSYTVEANLFQNGGSIDLASGAGFSGPVSGREIKDNKFEEDTFGQNWPFISFNGSGTTVPWFVYSVGGAEITGNDFSNTYNIVSETAAHIRARGNYDNSQFNWTSYWNDNTFNVSVVTLIGLSPIFDVRTYSYSTSYTFPNVRRIGLTIQGGINNAAAGDTVLVGAGTYSNSVTINKNDLALQGAGKGQTIIQGDGTTCSAAGIAISGSRSNVTIADLTVTGWLDGIQMFTGPLSNILIEDVEASNNCRHGIWSQAFGIDGLVVRRVTASNNNVLPYTQQFGRGIWIINGVKENITIEDGFFNNNRLVGIDVSDGNVTGLTISGNEVKGNGDSGIGVLGPQGPGATLVTKNTVTDNGRFGIEIKNPTGNGASSGPGSVVIFDNIVSRTVATTDLRDHCGIGVFRRSPVLSDNADQPSGVVVKENEVTGFHRAAVGATGDGFGIVIEGNHHTVEGNLVTDNDIGIQMQAGNPSINAQNTAYFDRGDGSPTSNASITGNTINNNEYGLRSIGTVTGSVTQNIIHNNSINGVTILDEASTAVLYNTNQICLNTAFGMENLGASTVNAENNWWGDPSGPTHATNPTGSGDVVSDRVDFMPFDNIGTSIGPCPAPLKPIVFLANEQVTIARSKHSASKGDIHSNGGIYFQRGDPNTYYGNLFAMSTIKIDKEIKIDGDATAGGKITLSGNAKILGTKTQYGSVTAIALPSLSYSAGGSNVTVAKKKTVSIAPGSYNNVIVNDGGTLKFVAGTYNLNSLETKDDENKLYFDVTNGPVIINIVSNFRLSEEVKVVIFPDGEDGSEKVTFNTMQSTQVLLGKESYVLGNINAPNAEVYLAKNVSFRGAISAKRITVDRDVYSLHHSSPGTLPFQKGSADDGEELLSEQSIVTNYVLSQNYPNPFNPSTRITFALPQAGRVQLHIYNSFGQLVRTLANRELAQGWHELTWDGRNQNGQTVATGVYLYRIIVQDQTGAATYSETRRMSFVK